VNKQKEFFESVCTTVESVGATILARTTTGGGHQRLDFEINGRRGRLFISTTPRMGKDFNAITTARRVVRAVRDGRPG